MKTLAKSEIKIGLAVSALASLFASIYFVSDFVTQILMFAQSFVVASIALFYFSRQFTVMGLSAQKSTLVCVLIVLGLIVLVFRFPPIFIIRKLF